MPGCYMYNFHDYLNLFHGVYGWCSSGQGPIYFDGEGKVSLRARRPEVERE